MFHRLRHRQQHSMHAARAEEPLTDDKQNFIDLQIRKLFYRGMSLSVLMIIIYKGIQNYKLTIRAAARQNAAPLVFEAA